MSNLHEVAATMVADGRGILAADESIGTMSSRLEAEGIAASETSRRDYRELLLTPEGLGDVVSGVIWCDETFNQSLADGTPFPQAARDRNIYPGIKVDTGVTPLANGGGATITEGLDGLGKRLETYAANGAAFAKWRAVIDITKASEYSTEVNAHALARYAALCQANGIVPIVEPEVLCTGDHDIDRCAEVSLSTLKAVFAQLALQRVDLQGIVLKPNMITPGLDAAEPTSDEIASATLAVLTEAVPADVPGIAFLSGGHPTERVCGALAAMNATPEPAPWSLTFSFGRALVSSALHTWGGSPDNVAAAQESLVANCTAASEASRRVPQPV